MTEDEYKELMDQVVEAGKKLDEREKKRLEVTQTRAYNAYLDYSTGLSEEVSNYLNIWEKAKDNGVSRKVPGNYRPEILYDENGKGLSIGNDFSIYKDGSITVMTEVFDLFLGTKFNQLVHLCSGYSKDKFVEACNDYKVINSFDFSNLARQLSADHKHWHEYESKHLDELDHAIKLINALKDLY
jgi:hypothetical protein